MPSEQSRRYPVVPGLIFLLILLGLLILPEVMRRLAIQQLQAGLAAPVAITDVDLNLFTGRARFTDLVVGSKDKTQPILHLSTLDLHFSRRALLQGEVIIYTATASRPELYLERTGLTPLKVVLRQLAEAWKVISNFTIKGFEVHKGQITVVDRTITPVVRSVLRDVQLTVRPVAQTPGPVSLSLKGTLAGSSSIKLHGWFTPFTRPLRLFLEGTVRDYELSQLNPYAKKYVGHNVRRGRVTNEFRYRYDAGTVSALNDIRIRQIQVGAALSDEFQRQVGIPLKLALVLLEDATGEIRLRVSVKGNVDSPEFQVSGVTWKGVRSAVLRGLVAPLRLVGHILTLGGKIEAVRINPVGFMPGSLTPDPDAAVRIDRLITFLRNRPMVELQLLGRASRRETRALARRRPRARRATEQDLRALAEGRVRLIERTLVRRGVAPKRLFVVTGDPSTVTGRGASRVDFRLLD